MPPFGLDSDEPFELLALEAALMTMAEFLQSKVRSACTHTCHASTHPFPHMHPPHPVRGLLPHIHTPTALTPRCNRQIDLLQPRIAKTSRALLGRATLATKHHVRCCMCIVWRMSTVAPASTKELAR